MRRAIQLLGLAALQASSACSETGVVLAIHSSLRIPAELDAICLQIATGEDWEFSRRYPLAEEDAGVARTLSVLAGEKVTSFDVLVRGERRGWPVSFQRVPLQFREHEVATEHFYLPSCGAQQRFRPGTARFPSTTAHGTLATGVTAIAVVPVAFAPGQMLTLSPEARRFAWVANNKGEKMVMRHEQGVPKNSEPVARLIAMDVDNDCDLDLIVLASSGPKVWRQVSGGLYEEVPNALYLTDAYATGAVADFNRDGYQDLVLVSATALKLLLNDSTSPGRFVDSTASIQGDPGGGIAIAVGLLDSDGNPDLVLVKGGSTPSLVLASNPGDATAPLRIAKSAIGLADKETRAVAVADFDGDGIHDLAFGSGAGPSTILLNSKSNVGTFTAAELPGTAATEVLELHAADLDNDCRRDIVLGTSSGVRVLLNTGRGIFSETSTVEPAPPQPVSQIASIDIDGDGLLDLVIVGGGAAIYHLQEPPGGGG
jgi:hypothetical protein